MHGFEPHLCSFTATASDNTFTVTARPRHGPSMRDNHTKVVFSNPYGETLPVGSPRAWCITSPRPRPHRRSRSPRQVAARSLMSPPTAPVPRGIAGRTRTRVLGQRPLRSHGCRHQRVARVDAAARLHPQHADRDGCGRDAPTRYGARSSSGRSPTSTTSRINPTANCTGAEDRRHRHDHSWLQLQRGRRQRHRAVMDGGNIGP